MRSPIMETGSVYVFFVKPAFNVSARNVSAGREGQDQQEKPVTYLSLPCLAYVGAKGLIGLQAPQLIVNRPQHSSNKMTDAPFTTHVAKMLMQGFAGMEVRHGGAVGGRRGTICTPLPMLSLKGMG